MKALRFFAVILLVVAGVPRAKADATVTGSVHMPSGSGKMDIELNAQASSNGTGSGSLTFSAPVDLHDDESASTPGQSGTVNVTMKVDISCVRVEGNRAAMSGTISSANVNGFVGRRVVLTVEDAGDGSPANDRLTWGFYGTQSINWFPSDAERNFDDGWSRTWIATDAERPADPGVVVNRDPESDCRSFPFSAYSFVDIPQGSGYIQVKPQ